MVECRFLIARGVGQRVKEEHDLGAALREPITDEQLPTAGARTPVDAPGTPARTKIPDLCELDSFPPCRRGPAAAPPAGPERAAEAKGPPPARVDAPRAAR